MCTSPIVLLRMQVVTKNIPDFRGFKKATYFSHIKGKFKTVWQLNIYQELSMLLDFLAAILLVQNKGQAIIPFPRKYQRRETVEGISYLLLSLPF